MIIPFYTLYKSNSKYKNKAVTVLQILSSAEIAGGERYLYDLINHSSKLIRHIIILPYKGSFAYVLKKYKVRSTVVQMEYKKFLRPIFDIFKIIKINKVNIVHTHGYRANFYGRIACLLARVKHITTVHVSIFDYKDTPKLLRYLYIFIEGILAFKTSRYICISKSMVHDMQKIKISQKKISMIPNGVDLKRFQPRNNQNDIKSKLGIDSNTMLIGTAGRMVSEKGQIYLIEALKQINGKIRNLKCIFLGEGILSEHLKNTAKKLDVIDMCIFAGVRYDIETLYPALDLFVLPSIREPFGLVLLEAMACQIPVLATESGGPLDFIKSGITGVLVPPKDADKLAAEIENILLNKNRAKMLAAEGRKFVEQNYDVRKTVKKVENLYFTI